MQRTSQVSGTIGMWLSVIAVGGKEHEIVVYYFTASRAKPQVSLTVCNLRLQYFAQFRFYRIQLHLLVDFA